MPVSHFFSVSTVKAIVLFHFLSYKILLSDFWELHHQEVFFLTYQYAYPTAIVGYTTSTLNKLAGQKFPEYDKKDKIDFSFKHHHHPRDMVD